MFRTQRRYPFEEIVQRLEREIRPPIETFAESLRGEYPDLTIAFVSEGTTQAQDIPRSLHERHYRLGIDCKFSGDAHADYRELDLAVFLQQHDGASYPHLWAWVAWLIDEESGGDWGVDIVYQTMLDDLDFAPHLFDDLHQELPDYFESFRSEIARKLSGELPDAH